MDENQALEKLHTDSSHVPGPGMDDRTWLNTATVVEGILRDFVKGVMDQWERNPEGLVGYIEHRVLTLNNLFLGRVESEKYSIGPWNTPDQLGTYIAIKYGVSCELRHAVRDCLMEMIGNIIEMVSENDFSEAALDQEITKMRNALLGTSEVQK